MSDRIVLPLDVPTLEEAGSLAAELADLVGVLKIGLELFVAAGPAVLDVGRKHGRPIFLDLKLHDIPETVERAVAAAAAHGVRYLTVHTSAGREALGRAARRAEKESGGALILLGITVLTSMDASDLAAQGIPRSPAEQALALARMAHEEGIQGFVCSPQEVASLRRALGDRVTLAVPGVRPVGADVGDQKRVATPTAAIAAGADLLVVGRPIRDAEDRRAAARAIGAEIDAALVAHRGAMGRAS